MTRLPLPRLDASILAAAALACGLFMAGCQAVGSGSDTPPVKGMIVNGAPMAYIEQGKGDTVVFVHGAFGDYRNWDGMRPIIAARYRVVAPSLRYHYPNEWTDNGSRYSLEQHVEDVAAFIRALDVGKVHLFGNSMGSRIIAYVAIRYPKLVRSLSLGEPFIIAPTADDAKAAQAAFMKDSALSSAAAKAGNLEQSAAFLYDAVQGESGAFASRPPEARERTYDNARTMGPYWRQPAPPPLTCEQLSALKMPVLVLSAEKSRPIFQYGAQSLLACLPKGTPRVVIPNARHLWFAENPQGGAEALLAFLQKN